MPRRKGFDINKWRPNCKCRHNHEEHDPNYLSCSSSGCYGFESDFWCINCESSWQDHETLVCTESERLGEGRPIGAEWLPMADNKELQHAVLKSIPVKDNVKELAGFIDLTDAEKLEEEEVKEKMCSEDRLIQLNDPNSAIDINLMVKGKKSYAPKQDLKRPEKSIKLMQKKGLIKK